MELAPGFKRTEVGNVPEHWECTTVADIAAPVRNAIVGGPFGSDLVSRDYTKLGIPVIRGQNMGGRWVDGDFVFVSKAKAKALSANLARPMDVVFTQRGTLGQVALVPQSPYERYVVSQSQMKLTLDTRVADPTFFYYQFAGRWHQRYIRDNAIQTGVPHINLGILRRIPVARPPIPEQRAIAASLSDADSLLVALEQLIAKQRDVKQAAMQRLLTGEQRLPGFDSTWITAPFGEITRPRGERIDPGQAEPDTVCVELDDIEPRVGRLTSTTLPQDVISLKTAFKAGDVLFGKLRAYLRKYWLADHDGLCSTEIWVLVADRRLLDPSYLFQIVTTDRFVDAASTAYGTHMPRSDWNTVRAYEVALPPLAEQRAIAAVLSDMDAELAALDRRLAKTRAVKQAMMQDLLTGRRRLAPSA